MPSVGESNEFVKSTVGHSVLALVCTCIPRVYEMIVLLNVFLTLTYIRVNSRYTLVHSTHHTIGKPPFNIVCARVRKREALMRIILPWRGLNILA